MLRNVAVLSLLTSTAFAQYFTGTSPGCLKFIQDLDNDSSLKSCSASLANATAAYGTAKDDNKTFTQDEITSTLNTICKPDSGCSDSVIKSKLGDFYNSCTNELTSKNTDVIALYDAIYVSIPMRQSICQKDDAGNFCVLKSSTTVQSQPAVLTTIQQYLWNKENKDYPTPNMTAISSTGLLFLFENANLDYNTLCTSCTRNTLTNYMTFQSNFPYAPGMNNSQALKGEPELYAGITKTCGPSFMSAGVQAAGGLGKGSKSDNGSLKAFGLDLVTVFVGIVTMAFVTGF